MRATLIIFCFCLALQTSIVHGGILSQGAKRVRRMAEQGLDINGIFRPLVGGLLGRGAFGFTYRGTMLHPNLRQVAMKFTPINHRDKAAREYEMYTYLYAINNENVEHYGIPAVYYYGVWEDYILMAVTLLDSTIYKSSEIDGSIKIFDILIMCQEFVRILKYIHCCGVRHNDIKTDNIMFRKNQGFIIDYNVGSKMYVSNDIIARKVQRSNAEEDWLCFLYAMLKLIGIEFETSDDDSLDDLLGEEVLREDVTYTIERIGEIRHKGLKRVFLELAKYVFEDEIEALHLPNMRINNNSASFYDHVYQIIQEEMQRCRPGRPHLLSWLTEQEILNARSYSAVPISSIHDLFVNATASYPAVDFSYFQRIYHH